MYNLHSQDTRDTPSLKVYYLMLFGVLLFTLQLTWFLQKTDELPRLVFQSPLAPGGVVPAIVKPAEWVESDKENVRTFGNATVVLPVGFTVQSGANVYGDYVRVLTDSGRAPFILPGTEFALGIWPAQDQTLYEKSIEIRFTLDAARAGGKENSLEVRMYDGSLLRWQPLTTRFDASRYQLVVQVKKFTPISKDFDDWGARTFFGIFPQTSSQAMPAFESNGGKPVVKQNANLRAGPGTNYLVIGFAQAGQEVTLIGKSSSGSWYKLDTGQWIAASLVDNVAHLPTVDSNTIPSPQTTVTTTPIPVASSTVTVVRNANLRAGPGTNYPIVGLARRGETIEPIGQSRDGRWYILRTGEWIAAFLVEGASRLPTVTPTPSS